MLFVSTQEHTIKLLKATIPGRWRVPKYPIHPHLVYPQLSVLLFTKINDASLIQVWKVDPYFVRRTSYLARLNKKIGVCVLMHMIYRKKFLLSENG